MAYPRRLLAEDEQVVLDLHPHWKQLLLPALLVPVVTGVGSYLVFALPSGGWGRPARIVVVVLGVLVLLRWALWPYLVWMTTRYVLTTRRMIVRRGVFGRRGRDVPLSRVNDVSFSTTLLERILRCGTVTIESAGEHGQVVLPEVGDVEHVQREVYRLVEAERQRP
jgi:uncharacterized membrane protein YdbT with pleckstrin-like domain